LAEVHAKSERVIGRALPLFKIFLGMRGDFRWATIKLYRHPEQIPAYGAEMEAKSREYFRK